MKNNEFITADEFGDDRFIATDKNGYKKGEEYFLDKKTNLVLKINAHNLIPLLNQLEKENKKLMETIEELEKLTGQNIDELVEFHMIMG